VNAHLRIAVHLHRFSSDRAELNAPNIHLFAQTERRRGVVQMPRFQDARVNRQTGVEYRYEAEYSEQGGAAEWTAVVSSELRQQHRLRGVVQFDSSQVAAWSAVASVVRSKIEANDFSRPESLQ
jgi:hypothetical protein